MGCTCKPGLRDRKCPNNPPDYRKLPKMGVKRFLAQIDVSQYSTQDIEFLQRCKNELLPYVVWESILTRSLPRFRNMMKAIQTRSKNAQT